ncbi:unnamed protein product, partial [Discosporangium mesarthrocarpum]
MQSFWASGAPPRSPRFSRQSYSHGAGRASEGRRYNPEVLGELSHGKGSHDGDVKLVDQGRRVEQGNFRVDRMAESPNVSPNVFRPYNAHPPSYERAEYTTSPFSQSAENGSRREPRKVRQEPGLVRRNVYGSDSLYETSETETLSLRKEESTRQYGGISGGSSNGGWPPLSPGRVGVGGAIHCAHHSRSGENHRNRDERKHPDGRFTGVPTSTQPRWGVSAPGAQFFSPHMEGGGGADREDRAINGGGRGEGYAAAPSASPGLFQAAGGVHSRGLKRPRAERATYRKSQGGWDSAANSSAVGGRQDHVRGGTASVSSTRQEVGTTSTPTILGGQVWLGHLPPQSSSAHPNRLRGVGTEAAGAVERDRHPLGVEDPVQQREPANTGGGVRRIAAELSLVWRGGGETHVQETDRNKRRSRRRQRNATEERVPVRRERSRSRSPSVGQDRTSGAVPTPPQEVLSLENPPPVQAPPFVELHPPPSTLLGQPPCKPSDPELVVAPWVAARTTQERASQQAGPSSQSPLRGPRAAAVKPPGESSLARAPTTPPHPPSPITLPLRANGSGGGGNDSVSVGVDNPNPNPSKPPLAPYPGVQQTLNPVTGNGSRGGEAAQQYSSGACQEGDGGGREGDSVNPPVSASLCLSGVPARASGNPPVIIEMPQPKPQPDSGVSGGVEAVPQAPPPPPIPHGTRCGRDTSTSQPLAALPVPKSGESRGDLASKRLDPRTRLP